MLAYTLHNMIKNNDNLPEKAVLVVVVCANFFLYIYIGKPAKQPAWTRERCPVSAA